MSAFFLYGRAVLPEEGPLGANRSALVRCDGAWITDVEVSPSRSLPPGTFLLNDSEVMVPGFIDMHTHLKMQALAPEVFKHRPNDSTGRRIRRYDRHLSQLDHEEVRSATSKAATELSSSGVTTCWTRLYFDGMVDDLMPISPRLLIGRTLRDDDRFRARMSEARKLAGARYLPKQPFLPALVLHETGLPDGALEEVLRIALSHRDGPLPIQAHVSQRIEEPLELGESAVERLARVGLLASGSFFAVHASYCSASDRELLEKWRVPVVYCPLAARRAQAPNICRQLRGRVPILLGTDTPPFVMGPQLRAAVEDGGLSWSEAFVAVTTLAASLLRLPTGAIAPGRLADLAIWRFASSPADTGDALIEAIVSTGVAILTITGGNVVHASSSARDRLAAVRV